MTKPKTKRHGNAGNKYAEKENAKKTTVQFRCEEEEKNAWEAAAEADGMSLSDWLRQIANKESRR